MTSKAASDKQTTPRRRLYKLHTWVGFHLAWVMSLVLLTGTFAVVSHEIDWLVHDEMRVTPPSERPAVDWAALEAAARDHNPGDTLLTLSRMPGDYFAYRARLINRDGQHYFLHVNQWTGEVTGETSVLTVQRVLRDLHRYLFMPNVIGLPLVTSLAFVLAISLYTGLKTTRKWGQAATRIRFGKSARVAVGDYHRAAGIWSIWFFAVMIVTGLWYLFEFGGAIGKLPLNYQSPNTVDTVEWAASRTIEFADAGQLVAAAKSAFPELDPVAVSFPTRVGAAARVQGRTADWLVRLRANAVWLNPTDASVLRVQRSTESPWLRYFNDLADPLHFGNFGGLVTKLIWFLFGALMTSLSLTGVWLTWKRLKTMGPSKAQIATSPVLVASALFCFLWCERLMGPELPEQEMRLANQSAAGHLFEVALATDAAGTPSGNLRLWVTAPRGAPNVASVELWCGDTAADEPTPVRTLAQRIRIPVEAASCHNHGEHDLNLRIEYRNGDRAELSWPAAEFESNSLVTAPSVKTEF